MSHVYGSSRDAAVMSPHTSGERGGTFYGWHETVVNGGLLYGTDGK